MIRKLLYFGRIAEVVTQTLGTILVFVTFTAATQVELYQIFPSDCRIRLIGKENHINAEYILLTNYKQKRCA